MRMRAGRRLMWASALCVTACCTVATSAATAAPSAIRSPEMIYGKVCGYCHGHNIAPIIRGRHLPAELIALTVRTGRGAMPAFRPTEINPAELAALARWIAASGADAQEHGQ